jgi:hypothetical protein
MADDLTVYHPPALDLIVQRVPAAVIQEGHKAAKALKDIVDAKPHKVMLGGKQYLVFEDWQTLGRFYNVTAKVVETKYVEYGVVKGFEARAVALRGDGAEISAAEAACLSDEPRWRSRPVYEWTTDDEGQRQRMKVGDELVPLFQLKSMAQTRACAKVLRTVLAWVVVLAGYEPTPAEEMPDPEKKPKGPKAVPRPAVATGGPDEPLRVLKVETKDTKRHGVQRHTVVFSDGTTATTIKDLIGSFALECQKQNLPVRAGIKYTQWGPELEKLERADQPPPEPMLTDADIPF